MNLRRFILAFIGAFALSACAPTTTTAAEGPVMITLTRSVCFGFCPAYRVTISGDGQVTYVGERFVNVVGERRASVPRADVERLLRRFDEADFDQLRDEYRAQVTDLPTYTITLERDGRRKTVVDYGGISAGMPRAVRELQDEIDRVANTGQWVLRDGQPVRGEPER
jgi:PAS domain-containing protein